MHGNESPTLCCIMKNKIKNLIIAKESTKLLFFILAFTLVGCSTNSFKSKIDSSRDDLLSEESFMRFNSPRLDQAENKKGPFVTEAVRACHQEKFKKGLELLEENTDKNKKNPEFWNALGTCYYLQNDNQKAYFYYNLGLEAVAIDQNKSVEAMIKNNLGLILLNNKRFNEAFDYFSEANKIAPQFQTPQFNMAQIYLEFYQNEKAKEILEKLKAKNPNDIDILYSLAVLYQRLNDPKKSYQAITGINSTYLNRADIVGIYALNLYQNKEFEKAKVILEKRNFADEFNSRNKMLLELVNDAIKAQKN